MSLISLLGRGYFPKELPKPFVTVSYANLLANTNPPPADFDARAMVRNGLSPAKTTRYSLARRGLFRRSLHVPNPVHHFLLCRELIQNWTLIAPHISDTRISATSPEFKPNGRAIDGRFPQGARPELAQTTRLGRRHVLQTDINRFYGGIYTHSIPWALHTKATAKADRTSRLLGNRLDYWVRMAQDQQTMGIPVGPDTSLVMAELILQRCDEGLLRKIPGLKGHRFIDDYELSFHTRTEAEDAYHLLETCLSEFELTLNQKKTKVQELPLPLEPTWATELKLFTFRSTRQGQAADLDYYFSKAYALHSAHPDEAVLQLAVARLRSLSVNAANWAAFQRLLLLCVAPEPACFPYVLEQIISRKNTGAGALLAEAEEIVNALVREHSALSHSSEVANALWACLALNLRLDADAVDAVSVCDDAAVALLALDCEQHGLTAKPLGKDLWITHMNRDALYDEFWLLAYEANVKGWLPSAGGGDHVGADPNFGFMKSNGVYFYDQSLAAPPPAALVPLPTLPTPMPVAEIGY